MATWRPNRAQIHLTGFTASEQVVREVVRSVEIAAKIQTSTGLYSSPDRRLARSIGSTVRLRHNRVYGTVGTPVHYARAVHNGARAHPIRPRNPNGYLRFYWRKVGHTVYRKSVYHPGQSGQFFLTRPLRIAANRHGFKVHIYVI